MKTFSRNKLDQDPTPAYFKLQRILQDRIETGFWAPGAPVPTERDIAAEHGVSRGTANKAILNLVSEGLLYRIQGKGTFVADNRIRRENLKSYLMLDNFDGQEARLAIEVLDLGLVPADPGINRQLNIDPRQNLYRLRRLFSNEKEPIVYTISYLPARMFPGLKNKVKDLDGTSLYLFLEREYAVSTMANHDLLYASLAQREVAELLQVPEGHPILAIDMQVLTHRQQPYEYRLSYCRTDDYKLFRRI
jgi:GntR family transcriptional regulator